ncbi:MAG: YfhO family protein, partial [Bacteroidia bacterium]|nr:YfhO family protein [Bacteroidia bacterium]
DDAYVQAYGPDFIKAVKEDRMSLFSADTLRSLLLVVTSAAAIWLFLKRKLSETALIIAFGVLILIDLVGVDRRYVNNDDFTSAIQVQKPFQMTPADREILNDTSYYRVFDMTSASTRASYYHNSLNGYHAAKLRRYNELFDFHIQRNNIQVLNMLNTKYIIGQDEGGQVVPFGNPEANGPAWFVQELITVNSADEEIRMLDSLDTKNQAVILKNLNFSKDIPSTFERDSLASISLVDHKPNYLKYESNNSADGLAVFSEVYYEKGWDAYIDGQAIDHFRVNYVLRALEVPKGTHTIEFKFEPQVVKTGSTIALASSLITALLILSGLYFEYKKK